VKKFKFRLESYLRVCRHRVRAEEIRLREILIERDLILREIDRLEDEKRGKEIEKSQKREFTSIEMRILVNYIESLQLKIYRLTGEVAEIEARIRTQQQRIIEARKTLKPVEKLKQRRKDQYRFEADRELQAVVDELHLLRRSRPSSLEI